MTLIRTTILLATVALVASCGTLKPTAKLQNANSLQAVESGENKEQPRFLNVKPIKATKMVALEIVSTPQISSKALLATEIIEAKKSTVKKINVNNVDAEAFNMVQLKYAIVLDVPVETVTNTILYQTIEEWYGTRYRFGGTTKRGVDCSSLMQHIYSNAFGYSIPRTAVTQYKATQRITQDELQEGDLIFFHTTRSGISHVGLYLGNRRFVHASSSRGVVVSNLDETYYQKAYRGAGRFATDYTLKKEEE